MAVHALAQHVEQVLERLQHSTMSAWRGEVWSGTKSPRASEALEGGRYDDGTHVGAAAALV